VLKKSEPVQHKFFVGRWECMKKGKKIIMPNPKLFKVGVN